MASSRKPGPLGAEGVIPKIEDGTLMRAPSAIPGPTGLIPEPRVRPWLMRFGSHKGRTGLLTLRRGEQGKHVRFLQVSLNAHGASPQLREDGRFGPKTQAAVIGFQGSASLAADGVVGPQTWMKLVGVPSAAIQNKSGSAIADWSLKRRFEEVLRLVPGRMAPELASQFRAMITPLNLGIVGATFAAWAVSHAFGIGEIADILAAAFLGMTSYQVGFDIGECLMITVNAEHSSDLDIAADHLAQAVAIVGVLAFFALLARAGAKFRQATGAAGDEAVATSTEKPAKPEVGSSKTPPASDAPESQSTEHLSGFSDGQIPAAQRTKVATNWYSRNPGFTHEDAVSRANGFDATRSMEVTTLKPGTTIAQWVRVDGKPGIDFTTPNTDPATLGIPIDQATGLPQGRALQVFEVTKPIQVLKGTAAPFKEGFILLVGGEGGGPQIAMSPGWESSLARVVKP